MHTHRHPPYRPPTPTPREDAISKRGGGRAVSAPTDVLVSQLSDVFQTNWIYGEVVTLLPGGQAQKSKLK